MKILIGGLLDRQKSRIIEELGEVDATIVYASSQESSARWRQMARGADRAFVTRFLKHRHLFVLQAEGIPVKLVSLGAHGIAKHVRAYVEAHVQH